MNMNVFSVETLMVQRRTEVEKAAMTAWQWSAGKNKNNLLSDIAHKFSLVKAKVEVQPSVCCCCS